MEQNPINPDEYAKAVTDKVRSRFQRVFDRIAGVIPAIDTLAKKIVFYGLLLALIGLGGYWFYWYTNVNQIRYAYMRWTDQYNSSGYTFSQDDIIFEGFLEDATIRIVRPTFSGTFHDTTWTSYADQLIFFIDPLYPDETQLELKNFTLQTETTGVQNRRGTIAIPSLKGTLRKSKANKRDVWKLFLSSEDVKGTNIGYLEPFALNTFLFSYTEPSLKKPNYAADIDIAFKGESAPVDPTMPKNLVESSVKGSLFKPIRAGAFARSFADWRADHGQFDAENIYLRWGPLSVTTDIGGASFSINSRGQLQSVFQADIINAQHISTFISYLAKNDFMDKGAALTAAGQAIQLPNVGNMKVLMLNGIFSINGVPFFPLPTFMQTPIVSSSP